LRARSSRIVAPRERPKSDVFGKNRPEVASTVDNTQHFDGLLVLTNAIEDNEWAHRK